MKRSELEAIKAKVAEMKSTLSLLNELGGITTETIPSDKVGFLWQCYLVNGVVVRRDYIADPSAQGTSADTAIQFVSGIEVKPNTYYSYNGKTYVYMGVAMVATSWDDVRDNMADWYE